MGVPRRSFLAALGLAALLCPAAHVDAQDGGGGGGGGDGGGEECSASSDAAFMYEVADVTCERLGLIWMIVHPRSQSSLPRHSIDRERHSGTRCLDCIREV